MEVLNEPPSTDDIVEKTEIKIEEEPLLIKKHKKEIEKELEAESESDQEDQDYFDATDQVAVTGNASLYPIVNVLQTELSQVKSLATITYTRLHRVEASLSSSPAGMFT